MTRTESTVYRSARQGQIRLYSRKRPTRKDSSGCTAGKGPRERTVQVVQQEQAHAKGQFRLYSRNRPTRKDSSGCTAGTGPRERTVQGVQQEQAHTKGQLRVYSRNRPTRKDSSGCTAGKGPHEKTVQVIQQEKAHTRTAVLVTSAVGVDVSLWTLPVYRQEFCHSDFWPLVSFNFFVPLMFPLPAEVPCVVNSESYLHFVIW